ncbi:hypothetical protein N9X05_16270 [Paracoccaceae bacterium]|nr:hypothetical protein [Paracoccaceae bacterium]
MALEAPYERATGGVYVMYICTLRQMGVLLFKGGYWWKKHLVDSAFTAQKYSLSSYTTNKAELLLLIFFITILPYIMILSAALPLIETFSAQQTDPERPAIATIVGKMYFFI